MSLKKALITCLLAMSALPALANDIDTSKIFDGQPMQVAALSQQEMKDTEGAWFWVMPVVSGAASSFGYYYNNPNWNYGGLTTSFAAGALGGAIGGYLGLGIGTFGSAYSTQVTGWW